MKCIKCNAELSNSVYQIHIKRCNVKKEVVKEIIKSEELEIKSKEYTLDQLLQMCLDNENIKHSPSTIKRWKEERCLKELNL